jgi:hypothetical protein
VLGRRAPHERERAADADEVAAVGLVVPQREAGVRGDDLVEAARGGEVGDADPDVVDVPGRADLAVVDGLRAVAVRIEQEAAVVVVAVLGPRPRGAIVAVPPVHPGSPERVDVLARARDEADVQPARDRVASLRRGEREVVPLGEARVAVGRLDAQRLEHRAVEGLRRRAVRDSDGDVVEHV